MNYEEQILELKKRIEILEKSEHKRIVQKRREIILRIAKPIVVTIILVSATLFVYNKYVKPYKEKIDYYGEKIDNAELYIKDKINGFSDIFS